MPTKRKAPAGCYWRNGVLWGQAKVKGTRYQWSLHTSDPKLAKARRNAEKDRLIAAIHHGEVRRTFTETLVAWAEWLRKHVNANTCKRYAVSITVLQPFLEGRFLDEVDGDLVAEIVRTRQAGKVTNATIKRDLGALSSVMTFAKMQGWRDDNPVKDRLGLIRERRDPIVLPDLGHFEIVAKRAPGRLQAMIRAALLTGCRQDELASAKIDQFDEARAQLTVIGKGSKRRTIDLTPEAVAVIRPTPTDTEYLFTSEETGGRYHGVATRFYDLCHGRRSAGPNNDGVRPFRFHDLRHRFAVDYLKNGGDIYTLKECLGHSSVKVTEGYLEHLTADEQRRAKFGSRYYKSDDRDQN
jgi:integrase/recombinase XerD